MLVFREILHAYIIFDSLLKTPVVVFLGTSTYSVELVIRRFTWVQQKCYRPYTPKYSFEFSGFLRAYSLNRPSVLYLNIANLLTK